MTKIPDKADSNPRNYVAVDPSKCTGCGICEYACAMEKSQSPLNPLNSRIRVLRLHPLLNAVMVCRFCEDARCVTACPEKALVQSQSNGVLIVNERKCKGCDWCIQACPHGGLALNPENSLAMACDLCDGEPKCIDFCPDEALELVSDENTADTMLKETIEKLPVEMEKLANLARRNEWSDVLEKAEGRAKKISEKLETISKRDHLNKD